ncbi:MAG: response regulator transcription factor [Devosia sp.]|nr:response regulator transcription factor [Devosia sp.]
MQIMIVSGQPIFRDALAAIATEDLGAAKVIVGASLEQAPQEADVLDLLLLDPPCFVDIEQWIAASAAIRATRRILVIPERNIRFARLALSHNFQGVLPKTSERILMVAILNLIFAGGEYFPCFDEEGVADGVGSSVLNDKLTPRQRQVLEYMRRGFSNKEIAKSLAVSVATIKVHVQAILGAAGARNRMEAVSRLIDSQD